MITTSASGPRASASRSSSAALGVSTSSTPGGAATARFAPSSVTCAPRRRASAASATPMRPDERLPTKRTASIGSRVPPAEIRMRLPASGPVPASSSSAGADDVLRLRHPPHAELALGRLALVGPDQHDAARPRSVLGVRPRRRVRPHARVHRRRDERRAAVRERRLGQNVVGEPVRELRERVRGARRDEQQVGARQVEIDVIARRTPRERAEGLGGDESLGAGCDERHDLVTASDQEPADLACLVGGNAAGYPEQDTGHGPIVPTCWALRIRTPACPQKFPPSPS